MSIYLIRHGQSSFNAVFDPDKPDPMIFDAPLSQKGISQAKQVRSNIENLAVKNVIVSPFMRTLQTASLIFGNRLPFEINANVREQLSNSCDVGSPPHLLATKYPHLDFDHLDECWWHEGTKDHRGLSVESHEILLERTNEFHRFLKQNRINSTAIVTHGNFIHALTGVRADNCQIVRYEAT